MTDMVQAIEARPASTMFGGAALDPTERARLVAMHDAGTARTDRHGEVLVLFAHVQAVAARVVNGASKSSAPRLRIMREEP